MISNQENHNDLQQDTPTETTITIIKRAAQMTWPLVTVGFIGAGESFAKTLIISKSSQTALAADGLLGITLGATEGTDTGFLAPLTPLLAQEFGKKNYEEIGRIVRQGWLLGVILSLPTMVVLLSAEPLLNAFGQDQKITTILGPYARVVSFACPAIYGMLVDTAFLKATSRVKSLIPFAILSSSTAVGLSYLLVHGTSNIPAQGALGLGYATLTGSWIGWTSLKLYFLTNDFSAYRLFNFRSMNYEYLKKMFKFGTPITFWSLGSQAKYFLVGMMIGWLGSKQLAINQAIGAYFQFFIPIMQIRQATQILVSQFEGMQEYVRMRRSGNVGILIEAFVDFIPLFIFVAFPIQLASNFLDESDIKELDTIIRLAFVTSALSQLLASIQGTTSQNLIALLDTMFPSVIQLLCSLSIILPLSYILAFVCKMDLVGINTAACIGTAVSIPPLLWRWYKKSHIIQEQLKPVLELTDGGSRKESAETHDPLLRHVNEDSPDNPEIDGGLNDHIEGSTLSTQVLDDLRGNVQEEQHSLVEHEPAAPIAFSFSSSRRRASNQTVTSTHHKKKASSTLQ